MLEQQIILILSSIIIDVVNLTHLKGERNKINTALEEKLNENGLKVDKKCKKRLDVILNTYTTDDFCAYEVVLLAYTIFSCAPFIHLAEFFKNITKNSSYDKEHYENKLKKICDYKDIQYALQYRNVVTKKEGK